MMTTDISSNSDIIDVRDIIARLEELEETRDGDEDQQEYDTLTALVLGDLRGNGGDEQWRGDWYPITLIRDSYFREYAMELAEAIGAISSEYTWPASCIDWDQAARELQMDYSSVEFDGVTYWYR